MPTLTTIVVSPAIANVLKGATQQYTAIGYDETDAVMVITPEWTSGTPAVGTIHISTGLFTAVLGGKSTITATQGAVSGTALARVYSTYNANILCKTIADYLVNTAGLRAFNELGRVLEDLDPEKGKALTEDAGVYVLYNGCDPEPETGQTIKGKILITFVVVDQMIATAADKNFYTADILRQYIAGGPQAWQHFGLDTVYPALNFKPFFLTSERVLRFLDTGVTWTRFDGYFDYYQSDCV